MAEKYHNSKGSYVPSPEKVHTGRDPPSPGKKRPVAELGQGVRLVSRGCTDDEVEVIRAQVTPSSLSRDHQRVLDISASRKRKTLAPSHSPVITPTTNIARRIDSIALEAAMSNSPVEGSRLTPISAHAEHMETSSMQVSSLSCSPSSVPVVGKNIEVPISSDESYMEQYLQRPEQYSNMKRLMSEEEGEGERKGSKKRNKSSPVKVPRPVASDIASTSVDTSSAIRLSTIVQPTSPSTPFSSSHGKKPHPSPHPSATVASGSAQQQPPLNITFPATTLPPMATLLPFPNQSALAPPILLTTPTTAAAPTTSPQHQSKTKSFSINDLLAKDPPSQQQQPAYSYINPTLLLLYHNWLAQNTLRSTQLFQGEPAEPDSSSVLPPIRTPSSPSSESLKSPVQSTDSRYSPHASPVSTTPIPPRVNGERDEVAAPPPESESNGRTVEGRQNALLQVSEAHLAILPDEDGDTPLHLAIIKENIPLTFYLVRLITGVSMNLDIANNLRQTPLHLAIITRQPMLVHLLVRAGASVNFPDRRGNTCVHLATQRKNVNILQILSQTEGTPPDYNARNFAGLTPVHVATREGSIDALKFLFQMGANKNVADSCSGRTSLHYAVESQNFQMCNFLLENGCNVNAVTFSGNTPLHVAAGRRLKEIVALLMAYGANPAIANGEGDFPSDLPASLLMQRAKLNTR